MRQTVGLGGKNFQPTSNIRTVSMMREATDFATHLRKCERAIADLKIAADTMLTTTKSTMGAPLPHIFEETAAGAGGDVGPLVSIGGPAFQPDTISRLSQQASAQIESQVLVPMKRWLEVFTALQNRMKELEALRLEVDSRRHTVIDLAASVDKQRAKLSKANGSDARMEGSLDDTIKKLQHKEGKLALSVAAYQEKEQSLYSDLSTLIKDAAWLRHYMASALRVQGESLTGAARALGDIRPDGASLDVSSLSLGSQGTSSQPNALQSGNEADTSSLAGPGPLPTQTTQHPTAGNMQASADATGSNPFLASGVIRQ